MTGGQRVEMLLEWRLDLGADVLGFPATGAEMTSGWWIRRRRHIALEEDALFGMEVGVGHRHGRKQGLGVRVRRVAVQIRLHPLLDDLPQIHDSYAVRDVTNYG